MITPWGGGGGGVECLLNVNILWFPYSDSKLGTD